MAQLTAVLQELSVTRVPPPSMFTGVGSIEEFFVAFERYCLALYKGDHVSYLQVLPTFLEGDAKNMVRSFGTGQGVDYMTVKAKLIKECSSRSSIGQNNFTDFFSATRIPGETLMCFSIRLKSLAAKVDAASQEGKEIMLKSKFMSVLSATTVRQLEIQFGGGSHTTLDEIVRLASIFEEAVPMSPVVNYGAGSWPVAAAQPALSQTTQHRANYKCYNCGEMGHFRADCAAPPRQKTVTCFKCGQTGHIARSCGVQSGGTGRSSGNQLKCGFCGEGNHTMMNCDEFKSRFLCCVWCGSQDHASHLCEQNPARAGRGSRPSGNGNGPEW